MRIALSTPAYNVDGFVEIDALEDSDLGETRRRVNRVATLDGSAAVNDFGHAWADRTIALRWTPQSAESEAEVAALVRDQSRLVASTPDGVFEVAPEVYQRAADVSTLRLLVLSKLSA